MKKRKRETSEMPSQSLCTLPRWFASSNAPGPFWLKKSLRCGFHRVSAADQSSSNFALARIGTGPKPRVDVDVGTVITFGPGTNPDRERTFYKYF